MPRASLGLRETVQDAVVVRRGVSQRLDALERVVLLQHRVALPATRAEQVEVDECPEIDDFHEHPDRHVLQVMGYEIPGVCVVTLAFAAANLHGALDGVAPGMVQARVEVRDYCVAVLALLLELREHLQLGEMFDADRHREESLAHLPVEGRNRHEVAEIEVDVLADVGAFHLALV